MVVRLSNTALITGFQPTTTSQAKIHLLIQSTDDSLKAYLNLQTYQTPALLQRRSKHLYGKAAHWPHGKISTIGLQIFVEMLMKAKARFKHSLTNSINKAFGVGSSLH